MPGELNLKEVAAELGVHYTTAYRYVRTGRLPARMEGNGWVVARHELAAFRRQERTSAGGAPASSDWRLLLARTLVAGDETGAWRVVEQALAAGHSPAECYLDIITGAVHDACDRATLPEAPNASEYVATATATRIVARLGARFRRPGRTRGTVVLGAPLGEHHTLAMSIVADLLRLEGFACLELGANVPPSGFAGVAREAHRLVAVGVGVTADTSLAALADVVKALQEVDPAIPVVVGGQATACPELPQLDAVSAWVGDGGQAVQVITALARSRRVAWLDRRAPEAGQASASA
ncbi:MAG: cobalamin-dependent protein [Acidimicrobiales bacterium]